MGGRLETILNIQKKDIDLAHGTITLKNLKTGETYKGFLQAELIEYLKKDLKHLKLNNYVINILDESIKTTSRQIQSRLKPKLDKMFNSELERDDRKNRVVIHTLRHTFASHLAINGTPIFTIKELMNHKDIEQTMRYAKLSPDSGKEFVSCLYK
jgi:integrase